MNEGSRGRSYLLAVVLAGALLLAGCSGSNPGSGDGSPSPGADDKATAPEEPTYSSWVVSIADEDSYTKDGITYTITLDLTATNPAADKAGTYTGSASAKTTSVGTYEGYELNASADAQSSQLEFTLDDPTGGGQLASITDEELEYKGTGSIVMTASGGGTYAAAGGSFFNTSGQRLTLLSQGSAITLKVDIDGHTYTFDGTIAGK